MFKRSLCVIAISLITIFLFSCARVSGSMSEELDGKFTSEELVNAIVAAAPSEDGYQTVEADYINRMNFGENHADLADALADWCIVTSARPEVNADIIGVFRLKSSADIPMVTSVINQYVAAQRQRMSSTFSSYAPAQMPKIENAEVSRCGNYFLVTFLEEGREDAAEELFEDMLER